MPETPDSSTDKPNQEKDTAQRDPRPSASPGTTSQPPAKPTGQQALQKRHYLIIALIIAGFLLLGWWFWASLGVGEGASRFPIAWFIIGAAVLGSLVNESFREIVQTQASYGWIITYVAWKCGVSVVFAFLAYLLVVGGLIGGELFPSFTAIGLSEGKTWNMEEFVTKVNPKDYTDVAKILVWSFIAGYSEKFVPNLIGEVLKSPHANK